MKRNAKSCMQKVVCTFHTCKKTFRKRYDMKPCIFYSMNNVVKNLSLLMEGDIHKTAHLYCEQNTEIFLQENLVQLNIHLKPVWNLYWIFLPLIYNSEVLRRYCFKGNGYIGLSSGDWLLFALNFAKTFRTRIPFKALI